MTLTQRIPGLEKPRFLEKFFLGFMFSVFWVLESFLGFYILHFCVQRWPDTKLRRRKNMNVTLSGRCDVKTQKSRLKYDIKYDMH